MHYITEVKYERDYCLLLRFEDGSLRHVDLAGQLDGEVFEPLHEIALFRTASLNSDLDTVVWDNGADMSPDFLYDISTPVQDVTAIKVAEERGRYGGRENKTGHE